MRKTRIEKHMTPFPHSIHSGMPLKTAKEMMRKYEIRHLPVQLAGHLVGVLSDRDLKLGGSLDREGNLLVEDVMTPDPYTVSPQTPLAEVVDSMARHKYGCAIVQDANGKVAGIFTATDGLAAFAKLLKASAKIKKKHPVAKKGKSHEAIHSLD